VNRCVKQLVWFTRSEQHRAIS